jgi:hypothetical protein
MARFTSLSFAAGTRSVTTWLMPIMTCQDTTSTLGGGKASKKSCSFSSWLILPSGFDSSCRRKIAVGPVAGWG